MRKLKISNFIKKIPKPYSENHVRMIFEQRHMKKIAWYYYVIFGAIYLTGINVFFSKNYFIVAFLIKISWLFFLITTLHNTSYNFAEGFIFYSICTMYFFHFFDIFMLFFCSIFVPNGHHLLKD